MISAAGVRWTISGIGSGKRAYCSDSEPTASSVPAGAVIGANQYTCRGPTAENPNRAGPPHTSRHVRATTAGSSMSAMPR